MMDDDGPCVCVCVYLGELALLVDERDDVHGFDGDHVQGVLVVGELDVLPADVLQVVLLLLQFEDMPNKELLQVLVRKVDAELLETTERRKKKVTTLFQDGNYGLKISLWPNNDSS